MTFSQSDTLTIVGIAVALVLGLGAIAATRAFGNRRGRVSVWCEATSLLPGDMTATGPHAELAVTFRGHPVVEPHLVKLSVVNVGPTDIPSTAFDAGRNLILNLNCLFYGALEVSHPERTLHTVGTDAAAEAIIQIKPGLLRRRDVWYFEAVCGGEPDLQIDSPLIDTTVSRLRTGADLESTVDLIVGTFPIAPLRPLVRLAVVRVLTR